MYSEPIRRQAMQAAWQSGAASLSGKVKLVQETQEDMQGSTDLFARLCRPGSIARSQYPQASGLGLLAAAYERFGEQLNRQH